MLLRVSGGFNVEGRHVWALVDNASPAEGAAEVW